MEWSRESRRGQRHVVYRAPPATPRCLIARRRSVPRGRPHIAEPLPPALRQTSTRSFKTLLARPRANCLPFCNVSCWPPPVDRAQHRRDSNPTDSQTYVVQRDYVGPTHWHQLYTYSRLIWTLTEHLCQSHSTSLSHMNRIISVELCRPTSLTCKTTIDSTQNICYSAWVVSRPSLCHRVHRAWAIGVVSVTAHLQSHANWINLT